jgi:hypothetical protein
MTKTADGGRPEVGLVVLVDSDPPSSYGEIGLYLPEASSDPPNLEVFNERHAAIREFVRDEVGGKAVVTVHTSQRYRNHMFEPPYVDAWLELSSIGADLALHPHEEREDGTNRYDELDHLERVVEEGHAAASRVGIEFSAFRSGFFAFHRELPRLLADVGIEVDLSAASGLHVPERGVEWPDGIDGAHWIHESPPVLEIPLGWSGQGFDLDRDYLFNERQDLAGLKRVYDAIRARPVPDGSSRLVNVLCHGHGLVRPEYREQFASFIEYARSRGGVILDVAAALDFHNTSAR